MSRQEGQSSQAKNNPVHARAPELYTGDMEKRDVQSVSLDDDDRAPEQIITADEKLNADYLAELEFNEEMLDVIVARGPERHAAAIEIFRVNGKAVWVKLGEPTTLKRKYVEVIARAMPYDVRTSVIKHEDREDNKVERQTIMQFPISVLRDPNPRGAEWLRKVIRES